MTSDVAATSRNVWVCSRVVSCFKEPWEVMEFLSDIHGAAPLLEIGFTSGILASVFGA